MRECVKFRSDISRDRQSFLKHLEFYVEQT